MMRRRVGCIGLAAAALFLVGAPAQSQDSGSERWTGSTLDVAATVTAESTPVRATFTRDVPRSVGIHIDTTGGAPGCGPAQIIGGGRTPAIAEGSLVFRCNGPYTVTAVAETTDDGPLTPHDSASRSRSISVAMPAPEVTNVVAVASGRAIQLSWDDMSGRAMDLSGYVVERSIGGGEFTEVAALGREATSFLDETLPPEGGEATYRVRSTRPSPEGTKVSAAGSTAAAPFTGVPQPPSGGDGTTTDGTTPPGDGTAPDPAAPGTPTTGAPTTPGGGPTGVGGRPAGGSVRVPRLGITGSFLPPLLRPSASIAPPTTIDDGFEEALPYDEDVEPGEQEPVLPDDELASVFSDDSAGRGMAIPVATALVLAVWAFHLRFLARAAAQPGAHVAR